MFRNFFKIANIETFLWLFSTLLSLIIYVVVTVMLFSLGDSGKYVGMYIPLSIIGLICWFMPNIANIRQFIVALQITALYSSSKENIKNVQTVSDNEAFLDFEVNGKKISVDLVTELNYEEDSGFDYFVHIQFIEDNDNRKPYIYPVSQRVYNLLYDRFANN